VISRQKIYEMEFRDYSAVALASRCLHERARRVLASQFSSVEFLNSEGDVDYYTARDLATGSLLKLKVLSAVASRNWRLVDDFYRQARIAARLASPNILTSGEAAETGGVHFCVVEHRPGLTTLRELLSRERWLDATRAADIADQIAAALAHAHQLGIWHLSLSPEKILIEDGEWVLVGGFGVESRARAASNHRANYDPAYASPEQVARQSVDHRSDLYALGAMLHEMLTGRTPSDGTLAERSTHDVTLELGSPIDLFGADVPGPFSDVVMRLIDRDPVRRPSSAVEFQSVLNSCLRANKFRSSSRAC